jgi:hypothetical protein
LIHFARSIRQHGRRRSNTPLRIAFAVLGLIILGTLIYFGMWIFSLNQSDRVLAALGIAIGLAAFAVAYWFAEKHTEQLDYLKEISDKLETTTSIKQNVSSILALTDHPNVRYKCIFPVRYVRKPLPLIAAGDFYALHLIQSLVDDESSIELKAINEDAAIDDAELRDPALLEGNCIYLCAPAANAALSLLAPIIDLDEPLNVQETVFCGVNLPAWFAMFKEKNQFNGSDWKRKVIYYFSDMPPVNSSNRNAPQFAPSHSPAEDDYKAADACDNGVRPKLEELTQEDYGVILRLTLPNFMIDGNKIIQKSGGALRKIIVIAGIYQYGTWIAGEFFSRIAIGEIAEHSSVFFGDNDFMAIIRGEFDTNKFKVTRCWAEHVWHYVDDSWRPVVRASFS